MSLKLFDRGACAQAGSDFPTGPRSHGSLRSNFSHDSHERPFARSGPAIRTWRGESLVERLQDLDGLINHLFASWLGAAPLVPSRCSHRLPNRQPLALTPLDEASLEPNGVTQRVFAWDVSAGGLSFLHRETLVCRTIAVTFQFEPGEFQSVLTRLKWCRFTRSGQYRSGGQFLRTIVSPRDAEVDFARLPAG